MDEDDPTQKLLGLFRKREGATIPSTMFSRLRRSATTAAWAAGAAAKSGLTSGGVLDEKAIERLVLSLGEMKGVAMKVGQILSYVDAPIPENLRRQLAVLQAQSPPTPFADIERTIREDLGDKADALLAGLDDSSVSSASIGQVHKGRLPPGDVVAVKVLHPGIEDALRVDFRGAHIGSSLVQLLVPGADVSDVIAEAEHTLLDECDYAKEATSQERFSSVYRGDEDIVVPRVHREFSSRRVLTTAWHDGASFEQFLQSASPDVVNRAGAALFRFYVETFYAEGFFNADPHPGNLLFHHDGRVVFLDYGCVREFSPSVVVAMARLSEAVRADDDRKIVAAFTELGARLEGRKAERERRAAVDLARAFFAPLLQPGRRPIEVGFSSSLKSVIEHKRALLRLHLPGELLFLMRIRFGAYSVLSRMGARLDWRALEAAAASRALAGRP